MAREPFKFRYGNELAGLFVLVSMGLLVFGIATFREKWEWLGSKQVRFRIKLPEAGSFGLRPGAEVRILGARVGAVEDITVDAKGNMEAAVAISAKFHSFVTGESEVSIKKQFGVAGDALLEITRGTGEPVADGGRLAGEARSSEELPSLVEEMMDEIRKEAVPTLRAVRDAVDEFAALARKLRDPDSDMHRVLANLRRVTDDLRTGKGTLGRLMRDPALADRLETVVANADAVLVEARGLVRRLKEGADDVVATAATLRGEADQAPGLVAKAHEILARTEAVLADVKEASARLPAVARSAQNGLDALPGLVLQTQATLREVERLVEALQKHWLVRGYVDRAPPGRIPPADAGGKR